jgi:DUF2971 family protein
MSNTTLGHPGSSRNQVPDVVYHYTTGAGLLGILSGKQLWQGDVEFMNDAEELVYPRNAVISKLRERAETIWPEGGGEDPGEPAWARAATIQRITTMLDRTFDATDATYHAYAACFCEDPDLLSQWRGYGGEGGYAVGIRTRALIEIARDQEILGDDLPGAFTKVSYGLEQADSAITSLTNQLVPEASAHWPNLAYHELMWTVLPLVASVKHPSFAEEHEWRLITLRWRLPEGLRFRNTQIGFVPYRTLQLPDDSFTDIMIGPCHHPAVHRGAVLQLLETTGLSNVNVRNSASPLRM